MGDKIKELIEKKKIDLRYNYIDKENSKEIIKFINDLFIYLKKDFLIEAISFIVRELVFNADKANLKRVYFHEKNMDIEDERDYKKGIINFSKDFKEKINVYHELCEKQHYNVRIAFEYENNILTISVRNNSKPTKQELDKILKRLEISKHIKDMMQAYTISASTEEGAGLGTIMSILMLRSLGIDQDLFTFNYNEQAYESVAKVSIPLDTVTLEQEETLSQQIADEVNSIPSFPENIIAIQNQLNNPDIPFMTVAKTIQQDPAFTAELLKIVNSSQYMLQKKVSDITSACSLLGVKGLKSLLYTYGTKSTLSKKYGNILELWEHSNTVATFAFILAGLLRHAKIQNEIFIAGILHDIGKIILLTIHKDVIKKLKTFCKNHNINENFMEHFTVGISHAKIGSLVAKKWNFPPEIVNAIEYHHSPHLSDEEYSLFSDIIYLADLFAMKHEDRFNVTKLEKSVLTKYKIEKDKDFNAMYNNIKKQYERILKK